MKRKFPTVHTHDIEFKSDAPEVMRNYIRFLMSHHGYTREKLMENNGFKEYIK